jgi:aminoglycoside phosphotransferase (APT) family kinase protein
MMHDDQVPIDADIVRRLIDDQFPEYRHAPIEQIGMPGTVNAIFRIGTDVAARFPLRLRCINLGSLVKGGQSRSRPVVDLQAPSLSG